MIKTKKKGLSTRAIVLMAVFATVVLSVTASIGVVLAFNRAQMTSLVSVTYKAEFISGSARVTYQMLSESGLENGEVVELGVVNFDENSDNSVKQISPQDALTLSRKMPYVEFTYYFTNTGPLDYIAQLSFDNVVESVNIGFDYRYKNYAYTDENFAILVQKASAGNELSQASYRVRMKVEDIAKNANWNGDFKWDLKSFETATEQEEKSVRAMNYTESGNGTYSVTYNGGELENNTLVIPSNVGGLRVTSVGVMTNLPRSAKIILNEGIITIEDNAFKNQKISEITLPDSLENIGNSALNATGIRSIFIPASVTHIGDDAFFNSGLQEIIVDANNQVFSTKNDCLIENSEILLYAFSNNASVPSGITEIKSSAFRGRSITSVHIPASLTTLNGNPFAQCIKLETITSDAGSVFKAENNCIIKDTVLYSGCKNSVIPNYVTELRGESFFGARIQSVVIPASVTSIGSGAFKGCVSLESVTFAENSMLMRIDQYAFSGCSMLTEITIPVNVQYIYTHAFAACTNVTEVYILSTDLIWMYGKVFNDVKATIYCALSSQPSQWYADWAPNAIEVIWGYNP